MKTRGFLGIDLGTQGLTILFSDEDMNVIDTGEAGYAMVPGLAEGCYEQAPSDWEQAVMAGARALHANLTARGIEPEVLAIGISGQMHGEVIGARPATARLWCDGRNEAEERELTELLGVKMPKRITAARWLWSLRNRRDEIADADQLTTPGGWLAWRLTGELNLGIGDASGMFPICQESLDFDKQYLAKFQKRAGESGAGSDLAERFSALLPTVRRAGEDGGCLNEHGASLLGLKPGIPVAPAEGDQPAALAGSLIGQAGMVSMSFGTSVCANSVGDRPFQGVSSAIDHFRAADGKPINMVWLRNGTTFMNLIVELLGAVSGAARDNAFEYVMPLLLAAPPDCDGVQALPFVDDEPGLGVSRGGLGAFVGLTSQNCTPGNVAKAALLATVYNLRMGWDLLSAQGYPQSEIVLSGGLTRTPELGQVIADVFDCPVRILDSGSEGSAWGAALLARYRVERMEGSELTWGAFLQGLQHGSPTCFTPDAQAHTEYELAYNRHRRLVELKDLL